MNGTSLTEELKRIVAAVGRENVYRNITDEKGRLLFPGTKPIRQGLVEDFSCLDFVGKSVIDLGCNFGYFAFLCARLGFQRGSGGDSAAWGSRSGWGQLDRGIGGEGPAEFSGGQGHSAPGLYRG